jgi:hypothetical protein
MYTLSVSYNNLIEISKQSSISIDEVFSQIKLYGISSIDIDYNLICNDFNTLSKIKRNNIKIASIISCDNISITENGLIEFTRNKLDDIFKVIKLKEDCVDCFRSEELLIFDFAQNSNNYKFCLETLETVLDRECDNDDSYFFRRLVAAKAKDISTKQNSSYNKKCK